MNSFQGPILPPAPSWTQNSLHFVQHLVCSPLHTALIASVATRALHVLTRGRGVPFPYLATQILHAKELCNVFRLMQLLLLMFGKKPQSRELAASEKAKDVSSQAILVNNIPIAPELIATDVSGKKRRPKIIPPPKKFTNHLDGTVTGKAPVLIVKFEETIKQNQSQSTDQKSESDSSLTTGNQGQISKLPLHDVHGQRLASTTSPSLNSTSITASPNLNATPNPQGPSSVTLFDLNTTTTTSSPLSDQPTTPPVEKEEIYRTVAEGVFIFFRLMEYFSGFFKVYPWTASLLRGLSLTSVLAFAICELVIEAPRIKEGINSLGELSWDRMTRERGFHLSKVVSAFALLLATCFAKQHPRLLLACESLQVGMFVTTWFLDPDQTPRS